MYINAEKVLPEDLIRQIQEYVQGKEIYIPKIDSRMGWGEKNGTKLFLRKRNREIYLSYRNGKNIETLMSTYHLSYDSIKRILRSEKQ